MAAGPRELLSSSALDSETFRIYCYKIVPCAKKFGHDWSECPFAHDGEKATRRCPALYRYSSIVCPEIRQSRACPRGDVCPYSHSIFEYWMHPARFRAQLCSFGTECNRRICFFAHTQDQLRTPSEPLVADALASRAPYLQGRVAPESRFALYPEQVPALVPVQAGVVIGQQHQQHQVLQQADLRGGMPMQQVVYVPAGTPQAVAVSPVGAASQVGAAGQQWAGGGSNMVFVPTAQAGSGAGMGYYVAGPAAVAAGPGGDAAAAAGISGGGSGQGYSAPMMVAPGMQVIGGGYSGQQPVQLMAAVAPDGSMQMQQYPVAPGGLPAGVMAYTPVFPPAGPAGMPVAPWAAGPQQQQQQPGSHGGQQQGGQQHALQLVQVPEGAEGGPAIRPPQEGFILGPAGQLGGSRGLAGAMEPHYAMMAAGPGLQHGPGMVSRPMGPAAGTGMVPQPAPVRGAGGDGSRSTPGVDDIAQRMAGWGMQ